MATQPFNQNANVTDGALDPIGGINANSVPGSTPTTPATGAPSAPISTPTTAIPNPITSKDMAPTTPVIVPTAPITNGSAPTPAASSQNNVADQLIKDTTVADTATQSKAKTLSEQIVDLTGNLTGQSTALTQAKNDAGIPLLRQTLQGINNQIIQKQAEINQDDVTLIANSRAIENRDTLLPFAQASQAKLAGDAAIIRALKTSQIGVLNAQALAAQGNITLAEQTAQDAVDAKYAPYKEQIAVYQAQLEALSPLLNADEKKQADQQQLRVNLALKKIDTAAADEKEAASLALKLQTNGAPQSVIQAALKAKTAKEVQAIPGVANFLISAADKLDLAIKQQQLIKARNDNNTSSDKVLSVDDAIKLGVPYGTTEKEAAALGKSGSGNELVKASLKDKVDSIDSLLTSKGMAATVGPNVLARSAPDFNAFTGVRQNFIAGVSQLTNRETLDTLINLKKSGGTLGALSEGEGKLLANAATKINAWAIKDKDGNVTGYNTTEKAFKEELNTIKKLAQRAYDAAGGDTTDVDSYLDTVDGALQTTNNAYAGSGYDLGTSKK